MHGNRVVVSARTYVLQRPIRDVPHKEKQSIILKTCRVPQKTSLSVLRGASCLVAQRAASGAPPCAQAGFTRRGADMSHPTAYVSQFFQFEEEEAKEAREAFNNRHQSNKKVKGLAELILQARVHADQARRQESANAAPRPMTDQGARAGSRRASSDAAGPPGAGPREGGLLPPTQQAPTEPTKSVLLMPTVAGVAEVVYFAHAGDHQRNPNAALMDRSTFISSRATAHWQTCRDALAKGRFEEMARELGFERGLREGSFKMILVHLKQEARRGSMGDPAEAPVAPTHVPTGLGKAATPTGMSTGAPAASASSSTPSVAPAASAAPPAKATAPAEAVAKPPQSAPTMLGTLPRKTGALSAEDAKARATRSAIRSMEQAEVERLVRQQEKAKRSLAISRRYDYVDLSGGEEEAHRETLSSTSPDSSPAAGRKGSATKMRRPSLTRSPSLSFTRGAAQGSDAYKSPMEA